MSKGEIWYALSQARAEASKHDEDLYETLLKQNGTQKDVLSIVKDITRTFPKHYYFYERYGKGQTTLFNVLKALS